MTTLEALRSGQLAGSQRLQLAAGLTTFPPEILQLADTLEILDLTHNRLHALPDEVANLKQLKIIFLSHNEFEVFPSVLGQCPQLRMIGLKANRINVVSEQALPSSLRWLILTDNHLAQLPADLDRCPHLQKLMLAGNRLRSLPASLSACQNLELIRIAANQLDALPEWLFTLPRLAWLACASNAGSQPAAIALPDLPSIPWTDLTLVEKLGEGASGITWKAVWQQPQEAIAVAVKLFKGGVTSDGLPTDEMQAGLAAGGHPQVVNVVGKLRDHPDQTAGLVFDLIPPDYRILGNPPDFDSCTRDTYPADTSFPLPMVQAIARSVASAVHHLHQRGILHGDLYAHNILVNAAGSGLLGDFGAASFYDPADLPRGQQLERLEVRAFGCLLEDLLDRCPTTAATTAAIARLRDIQHACLQPIPAHRPLFADLCSLL